MKEIDVSAFPKAANRLGERVTVRFGDLIHLPDSLVQEDAADCPLQIMGRRTPIVPQTYRFLNELLDACCHLTGMEYLPDMDTRDADEPIPIEGSIAMQRQKIQVGACSVGDVTKRMRARLPIQSPCALWAPGREPGV